MGVDYTGNIIISVDSCYEKEINNFLNDLKEFEEKDTESSLFKKHLAGGDFYYCIENVKVRLLEENEFVYSEAENSNYKKILITYASYDGENQVLLWRYIANQYLEHFNFYFVYLYDDRGFFTNIWDCDGKYFEIYTKGKESIDFYKLEKWMDEGHEDFAEDENGESISTYCAQANVIDAIALGEATYDDFIKRDSILSGDFYIKDGVLLEYYEDGTSEVVIPDSVKEIGEAVFYEHEEIESVIISKNCTKIGDEAFYSCVNLQEIVIPDSVTEIGEEAFCGNYELKKVVLSKSLKKIGKEAFSYCNQLEDIVIPDSVEEIGDLAFSMCGIYDLKHPLLTIKNGFVLKDNKLLYRSAEYMPEIDIPEGITEICDYALDDLLNDDVIVFDGSDEDDDLKKFIIKLPNSIERIGIGAFRGYNCDEVILPNSLEVIDECAFQSSNIEKIVIPSSVKSLGEKCFCNCNYLKDVEISDSVEYIGSNCFADCPSLSEESKERIRSLGYTDSFGEND